MHNNDLVVRQRKLRFEEEEIWTELPDSTREQCRTLWRQLLANVLKMSGGRRMSEKIKGHQLERGAYVYVRQSTPYQVRNHLESKELQYALAAVRNNSVFAR